jgi:hypothetical protein
MRNITEQAAQALFNLKDFKKSNTCVDSMGHIAKMFLHGHRIAYYDAQKKHHFNQQPRLFHADNERTLERIKGR